MDHDNLSRVIERLENKIDGIEERFAVVLDCKLKAHIEREDMVAARILEDLDNTRKLLHGDGGANEGLRIKVDRIETGVSIFKWVAGTGLGTSLLHIFSKFK